MVWLAVQFGNLLVKQSAIADSAINSQNCTADLAVTNQSAS